MKSEYEKQQLIICCKNASIKDTEAEISVSCTNTKIDTLISKARQRGQNNSKLL